MPDLRNASALGEEPADGAQPTHVADLELARRAAAGHREAVQRLVTRLPRVAAMVRAQHRRMGSPLCEDELADVIQNALMAIWRKLGSYEGRAALETWMCSFGGQELRKATHRRYRERCVDAEGEELIALAGSAPTKRSLPFETQVLYESLGGLDTAQGFVVRAHVLEQQSFPCIARELSIPLGTAKTLYYRALGRLRVMLAPRMS